MAQPPTVLDGMSMHPDAAAQLARRTLVQPLPTDAEQLGTMIATISGIITYAPSFEPVLLSSAPQLKIIACHACPCIARPTTLREARSSSTERYNQPSRVGMYVMSPTRTMLILGASCTPKRR